MMRISLMSLLTAAFSFCGPLCAGEAPDTVREPDMRPNAVAFRQMKHGLFVTHTYGLTAPPPGMKITTLDEFADAFDVKTFAGQMEEMGVEYVYFTAWHKAIHMLGPSRTLDKWIPGHTAKRDLVGELADELKARKIRLLIYAHPNDAHDLTPEEQKKIGFTDRAADPKKYNDFTNELLGEMAARYGKKPNVIGFWWDSWWHNGGPVDMPRLRKTVLKEFPGAIILSNKYDPRFIDFESGEGGRMGSLNGRPALKDNQCWYLGNDWWNNNPGTQISISPEDMYRFLLLNVGTGAPGGMSWSLSPLADGKTWGANNQPLKVMQELGKLLAPVRPTICGVLPSHNWQLQAPVEWANAPAFVAGRSPDHRKEYIHVMKPPQGMSIDLPKPKEEFQSAVLYGSRDKVAMSFHGDVFRLTLPEGTKWAALDTVIELTVKK